MPKVPSPPAGVTDANPLPADCAEKYQHLRRIASGGYGAVFQARHRQLEKTVAIKLLLEDVLKDPEQVQRFTNEARITASLAHPSIIQVLDHGAGAGTPWIAYEYVTGKSLRDRIDESPGGLDLVTALQAMAQVADALDAAHSRGVLHRDIKPDNVLESDARVYKVADFGIAKWAGEGAVKTRTGVVLGTPAYISPEQITGDSSSVSSDIYALGIMLFEVLTGKLPYRDDSVILLLERHLKAPIPLPSQHRTGLPPRVDEILVKALAKKAKERYASAREMRDDLLSLLAANDSQSVEDAPARPVAAAREPSARFRTQRISRASNKPQSPTLQALPTRSRTGSRVAAALLLVVGVAVLAAALRPGHPKPLPTPTATERPDRQQFDALRRQIDEVCRRVFLLGKRYDALFDTILTNAGQLPHGEFCKLSHKGRALKTEVEGCQDELRRAGAGLGLDAECALVKHQLASAYFRTRVTARALEKFCGETSAESLTPISPLALSKTVDDVALDRSDALVYREYCQNLIAALQALDRPEVDASRELSSLLDAAYFVMAHIASVRRGGGVHREFAVVDGVLQSSLAELKGALSRDAGETIRCLWALTTDRNPPAIARAHAALDQLASRGPEFAHAVEPLRALLDQIAWHPRSEASATPPREMRR